MSKGCRLALLFAPFELARRHEALLEAFGNDQPEGVQTYEADITSAQSVTMAFEYIATDAKIDGVWPSILINAAGYVSVQPLEKTSAEEEKTKTLSTVVYLY